MRDYVTDGVNGLLVARGDARALRGAIERLQGDEDLRARLAAGGLEAVRSRFNQAAMWHTIAERMHRVLEES
jgi:glycosyltransferase involved in cell wall biosynthesis